MSEPVVKPLTSLSDDEFLDVIFARYRGQFTALDFSEDATRSQLALDLGMLIGLATRLVYERDALRAQLATSRQSKP